MQRNRRTVSIVAGVLALGAGTAGIAYAVGGDSEEQVKGANADKAGAAALKAVGGGTVTEIERQDGDGAGAFEVEVKRADGAPVEVWLDSRFQPVGTTRDDDSGSGSDDDDDGENEDE